MPVQPRAYAWIDALLRAIEDRPDIDGLRFALLLDSLVRTSASLERGLRDAVPPAWLGEAVAVRFPRLTAAPARAMSPTLAPSSSSPSTPCSAAWGENVG